MIIINIMICLGLVSLSSQSIMMSVICREPGPRQAEDREGDDVEGEDQPAHDLAAAHNFYNNACVCVVGCIMTHCSSTISCYTILCCSNIFAPESRESKSRGTSLSSGGSPCLEHIHLSGSSPPTIYHHFADWAHVHTCVWRTAVVLLETSEMSTESLKES